MNARQFNQVSRQRVSDDFGAAAESYDAAARLQQRVALDLLARMNVPGGGVGLDLGCGTGFSLPELERRLAPRELIAADLSPGMIDHARAQRGVDARWLVADAANVPLASGSLDWIQSSLMIQWCEDTGAVAREMARLLGSDGEAHLATLVDGTLTELESAWEEADPGRRHVNHFLTRAELETRLAEGFEGVTVDVEPLVLWYPDVMALLGELKTLGASYKDEQRHRGALGPGRLKAMRRAYDRHRDPQYGVPATWQVAFVRLTGPRQ
ncbi:methyltransferase domain-containing protein [Vreelandella utahensis]|uniref:methyltransferase domain-containing protein n=1 Tax=Vreelandella halophila TaxID=86177 RepID=UPI000984FFA0|nr:methyltransferase domain-containing protein [Halomonas utahensis]